MNMYRNIDRSKIQFDFLCMSNDSGDYDEEIKNMGGKIYRIDDPKNGMIKNLKQTYKILKENNFVAIHSHVSYYSGYICLVAHHAGLKNIITHSHTTNNFKKNNIMRKSYNFIARSLINKYATTKLACGEKAGQYLYGKKDFSVINNGINIDSYYNITDSQITDLKNEMGINENDLIIGHVGRFAKVKNQEFFIEFANTLQKENQNFKILLVGNGDNFEIIKNKIKENKLEQYFIMPGLRKDIPVFMKMFDIFIMPSLYEGFPLVVVEALAGDDICFLSDTISKETNVIPERVSYFNLNDNLEDLVNKMLKKYKEKETIDVLKELEQKGYSNKKIAEKLQSIYLK